MVKVLGVLSAEGIAVSEGESVGGGVLKVKIVS